MAVVVIGGQTLCLLLTLLALVTATTAILAGVVWELDITPTWAISAGAVRGRPRYWAGGGRHHHAAGPLPAMVRRVQPHDWGRSQMLPELPVAALTTRPDRRSTITLC